MARTIDVSSATTITLKNSYDVKTNINARTIASDTLDTFAENDLWNTGMAALGDPHIDEILKVSAEDETTIKGATLKKDVNGFVRQHAVSIRLYRSANSYVTLYPGDSVKFNVTSQGEALYYLALNDPNLEVTVDGATDDGESEMTALDIDENDKKVFLDRTTGIGDADDGDPENGNYPFGQKTDGLAEGTEAAE